MRFDFEALEVTHSGPIMEIALNRAGSRNAISTKMHEEIIEAFNGAPQQPGVRAILFAAHGNVFSAGGDFDLMLAVRGQPEKRSALAAGAREIFMAIVDCPLPVVAALQGDAVGLGATLVLGCDAIVASRNAKLSDPHVVIGLAAGDGGCVLWPESLGLLRAKRYLLTGDRLTTTDAYAMGLVTDLVETPDEVRPAARALAQRIAALPPLAVQLTKRALNKGLQSKIDEVFDYALNLELDTFFSDDAGEAIAATRERRPGIYHGR